eukprot:TRINITY_DN12559_c0_g1_i1.p1 TRINITY_DN12559_c0_g1~~TRINITY_DN12559_c0_g1_i1.p1  ORF type:complete len:360 (-),score=92.04 TRINITY_DN12559_c0_g1_i1:117-1196(-)
MEFQIENSQPKSILSANPFPMEILERVQMRMLEFIQFRVIPEIRQHANDLLVDAYWAWGLKCNVDVQKEVKGQYSASKYLQFCVGILFKEVERMLDSELRKVILSDQSCLKFPKTLFGKPKSEKSMVPFCVDKGGRSDVSVGFLGVFSSPLGAGAWLGMEIVAGLTGVLRTGTLVSSPVNASNPGTTTMPHQAIEAEAVDIVLKGLQDSSLSQVILNTVSEVLVQNAKNLQISTNTPLCSASSPKTADYKGGWKVVEVKVDQGSVNSDAVLFAVIVEENLKVTTVTHRFSKFHEIYLELCDEFPTKVKLMSVFPSRTFWRRWDLAFLNERSQGLLEWLKVCEADPSLSRALCLKSFLGM